jgi:hypothetical protein
VICVAEYFQPGRKASPNRAISRRWCCVRRAKPNAKVWPFEMSNCPPFLGATKTFTARGSNQAPLGFQATRGYNRSYSRRGRSCRIASGASCRRIMTYLGGNEVSEVYGRADYWRAGEAWLRTEDGCFLENGALKLYGKVRRDGRPRRNALRQLEERRAALPRPYWPRRPPQQQNFIERPRRWAPKRLFSALARCSDGAWPQPQVLGSTGEMRGNFTWLSRHCDSDSPVVGKLPFLERWASFSMSVISIWNIWADEAFSHNEVTLERHGNLARCTTLDKQWSYAISFKIPRPMRSYGRELLFRFEGDLISGDIRLGVVTEDFSEFIDEVQFGPRRTGLSVAVPASRASDAFHVMIRNASDSGSSRFSVSRIEISIPEFPEASNK